MKVNENYDDYRIVRKITDNIDLIYLKTKGMIFDLVSRRDLVAANYKKKDNDSATIIFTNVEAKEFPQTKESVRIEPYV